MWSSSAATGWAGAGWNRDHGALPDGAVLVVGAGQTGLQLAEELLDAGCRVFVSVGSARRIPRRYRGREIFGWLVEVIRHGAAHGVTLPTAEQLPDGRRRFSAMPALTGRGGGHDTNLRQFAADGVALGGRLVGANGELVTFAGDLDASLAQADSFFDDRFRPIIDTYIERAAVDAPPADLPTIDHRPVELTELNLRQAGVSTIIWATGYGLDHGWIDAPVLDELGYPGNVRGVAAIPGLYSLGLLWQHSQASASLVGPGLDGPYLVDEMAGQARRRRRERALIGRPSPSRS